MATYSFMDVTASLTGVTGSIDLGYGSANSEEGITVTMTEAKTTMTIGADGEFMHSLHAGKSGSVTVTLLKTSPVNKKLSLAYNAQSQSSATWGNNVIVIRNHASGDITTARGVAFQKQPDHANAKVGNTVSWVFDAGKIDQILGEFSSMEFEINGYDYRTAKLGVFEQLKVSRKLLPVLAGMMSDFSSIKEDAQNGKAHQALEAALPKIAGALAEMSDDDVNAILHPCLSVVSRKHAKGWTPVFSQGELMFDDIDMLVMLQLVGRVVGDSLGSFLPATPASETVDKIAG